MKKKIQTQLEGFTCRQCGHCCQGEGFVSATPEECRQIAEFLGMEVEAFLEQYTREVSEEEYWLLDGEGREIPCIFLEQDSQGKYYCRINSVKPRQCRDFPFKWRRAGIQQWCKGFRSQEEE